MTEYQPGVCNIGPAEIARRKRVGYFGLALTVVLWVVLVRLNVPHVWRLLVFFPAAIAAGGFLQAYFKFCANFGLRGVLNFGPVGKTESVVQAEARKLDRQKAWQIISLSILAGFAVGVVAYLLPV